MIHNAIKAETAQMQAHIDGQVRYIRDLEAEKEQ